MKNTFAGAWTTINYINLDDVINLIVTGKNINTIIPDGWLSEFIGDRDKPIIILDFGCGIGRNSFDLAIKNPKWTIIGYDSEQMISRIPEYVKFHYNSPIPNNLWFISDWEQLKCHKFDKIIAILVFQHIFEKDIIKYCMDIKQMTNFLLVSGRRYNDDSSNKNTWTILEEQGFIPTKFISNGKCIPYTSRGDQNEHNTAFYYFEK